MSLLRVLIGSVVMALLASVGPGLASPGASPPAAATGAAEVRTPQARVAPVAPSARKAVKRLTPRERRLSKLKPCSARQWRRTPVRCKRIKSARAKARAMARASGHRPPAVAPGAFTVAVVPDTQQEVFGNDTRMRQRSQWLVSRRSALDLRFVTHVGDVVNWGWLDPRQFAIARDGMRPLEQAGIPYSLSVGNHDTGAVGWNGAGGYGGDAYVKNPECGRRLGNQCRTDLLVRRTQEFNAAFSARRFGAVAGAFENGKVDNTYSTFSAGGRRWMVLNLEMWPREAALEWARRVVSSHPRHNVIISTHSYLDGNAGRISASAGYGSTSPARIWNRLVSQFPNVQMVLSGHAGTATVRTDTGRHGNKVVSLLQTFHSAQGNPVRLVRIDPRGRLHTWVVSPNGRGGDFRAHDRTIGGLSLVG